MPTLALYARKSSESEDRQVLSIDSQVQELRDCARAQGLTVGVVYTESKSAKAPGRPVFGQVIARIQKGEIDGLLCWKLDRLARNPVDGGALIWAMEEGHLKAIHTPQRSFQSTSNDKFWMQLEFGMAKKYVDDLSDNVKRGLRAKLAQGWMPGLPPLGYLNERNSHTIIKDPVRFPIVRKMWDLMLTGGITPKKVLDVATEKWGLRTRTFARVGGGPMQYSAIYKVLTNPFYYGAIRYNGELLQGAHPAMVTIQEFDRVQDLLGLASRPRPLRHRFAYTGLIRCGECGAAITAEHKTQRHGHHYVYYHCTKRKRSVKCSQGVIDQRKLDAQIAAFLGSLTISHEMRDWSLSALKELQAEDHEKDKATLESLHRRYEALQKELGELVNMRLRGLLADGEFAAKKAELEAERIRVNSLLNDRDGRKVRVLEAGADTFDFAHSAKQRFESGASEMKRAILCYTGSNLSLINGKLLIEPQKPLSLIQKVVSGGMSQNRQFEPALSRMDTSNTPPLERGVRHWLTLVSDVRTYYLNNSSAPTFKQTLARVRESFSRDATPLREKIRYQQEIIKEQRAVVRLHRVYQRRAPSPDPPGPRRRTGGRSVPGPTGPKSGSSGRFGGPTVGRSALRRQLDRRAVRYLSASKDVKDSHNKHTKSVSAPNWMVLANPRQFL